MIIRNATLETVCGITSKIPENSLPEIAFAGKSNVGKSSLINSLMNRKNLARTSSAPGKTQTINFYKVESYKKAPEGVTEDKENREIFDLYFTDLPGYGYAKVSKSESEKWGAMIDGYLTRSKQLRSVFLLIDIRHAPGANDRQMYDWIVSKGFEPVIIATKYDKISKGQRDKQLKLIRTTLGAPSTIKMIPFSALNKQGREEIYQVIKELCN